MQRAEFYSIVSVFAPNMGQIFFEGLKLAIIRKQMITLKK